MSNYNLRGLTAPRLIRVIFDRFPLRTYPSEKLPSTTGISSNKRSPLDHRPILYISDDSGTHKSIDNGVPSRDPPCLKWQTILRICNVDFELESSNNHASPSGSLPYFLPPSTSPTTTSSSIDILSKPIASLDQLEKWITSKTSSSNSDSSNIFAHQNENEKWIFFQTLLDTKIRAAWQYCVYMEPNNFTSISLPFLTSATPMWPVNTFIGHQVQQAIATELKKSSPNGVVCAADIYSEADAAFAALSGLLGGDQWFWVEKRAGVMDAAIFAYTDPILSLEFDPMESNLVDCLRKYQNLVGHRDRMRSQYYGSSK